MGDNNARDGGGMTGGGGPPTGPGPVVTTGTISGTVSAGATGVAGAQIALGSDATTTSAASGQYSFANVASGTHSLTLTAPSGFALATNEPATKNTSVAANQTSTVDWALVQLPPPPTPPKTVEVSLEASRFSPRDVAIARGDTVRWVNAQPIAHTITPDDRRMPGTWPAQNIPARAGSTFSHTFDLSGIYTYNCTIHFGMTGVIRVP
jgi:plastocyanin